MPRGPRHTPSPLHAFETATVLSRIRGLDAQDTTLWYFLSVNSQVTWEIVQALPEKPWDYRALSRNINITWEHVSSTPQHPWNLFCLASHTPVPGNLPGGPRLLNTWSMLQYSEYTWEAFQELLSETPNGHDRITYWQAITENEHVVNWPFIRDHPVIHWSSYVPSLSRNAAMDEDALVALFERYPEIEATWCWTAYSMNPAVTWALYRRFQDKPWCMYGLSSNPKVCTWARLHEAHSPAVAWDWKGLSRNPAVATYARVMAHPELPWNADLLSCNPEVCTWQALFPPAPAPPPQAQAQAIRFIASVWMHLQICTREEMADYAKRHMAAWRIQRAFREAISVPHYGLCRSRLWHELEDMNSGLLLNV